MALGYHLCLGQGLCSEARGRRLRLGQALPITAPNAVISIPSISIGRCGLRQAATLRKALPDRSVRAASATSSIP